MPNLPDLTLVKKLAEYGHTDLYMAEFFSMSLAEWERLKVENPHFRKCLAAWEEFADDNVKRKAFERAIGFEHETEKIFCNNGDILTHDTKEYYPPSDTAIQFWLTNRQPDKWKNKQEVKHDGAIGVGVSISDSDLAARLEAIAADRIKISDKTKDLFE